MIILAVDATGPVAGVAVTRDGKVLVEHTLCVGLTHSETLQPMIEGALHACSLTPGQIDLFACVSGPGSFTGVRIGVCAVKAMAQATGKPCVGLDALEVLAASQAGFEGTVCPILDARRGQVYAAAFDASGDVPRRLMDDAALPLAAYLELLPREGRLLFVGDGVAAHGERAKALLGGRALIAPDDRAQLRPAAACRLALTKEVSDYLTLSPIYLRAPQAERERMERLSHE